jgi:hypothetical protein
MLICVCLRILISSRIPRYDLGRQTPHFWCGSVTLYSSVNRLIYVAVYLSVNWQIYRGPMNLLISYPTSYSFLTPATVSPTSSFQRHHRPFQPLRRRRPSGRPRPAPSNADRCRPSPSDARPRVGPGPEAAPARLGITRPRAVDLVGLRLHRPT